MIIFSSEIFDDDDDEEDDDEETFETDILELENAPRASLDSCPCLAGNKCPVVKR